ncbi:MAG: HAMP domain-containing histidine kinase [Bacteroidales bacterium]|nr:HAMP domain-containing histidine kinase [Bacteroidales bacterium]
MSHLITVLCCLAAFVMFQMLRQRKIRRACRHITEALDNNDYTFRLSSGGIMFLDKPMIGTFNTLLQHIGRKRQEIEVQSWEKLTRILTHEIMNGIAPVISLTDVFMNDRAVTSSPMYEGIKAIHDTSTGLMEFVDSYRKFTSLQDSHPEQFSVQELLESVCHLSGVPSDISLNLVCDMHHGEVYADRNLFRQMIVNIVKNAVEAFAPADGSGGRIKGAMIQLYAYQYGASPLRIRISNNGSPIPDHIRQDIFIPFFSTKKKGSGIGLALCRQIMTQSGGTINLLPAGANGWVTSFIIEMPFAGKKKK